MQVAVLVDGHEFRKGLAGQRRIDRDALQYGSHHVGNVNGRVEAA